MMNTKHPNEGTLRKNQFSELRNTARKQEPVKRGLFIFTTSNRRLSAIYKSLYQTTTTTAAADSYLSPDRERLV